MHLDAHLFLNLKASKCKILTRCVGISHNRSSNYWLTAVKLLSTLPAIM